MKQVDVVVIGGGPAGLAAALESKRSGAETLLIERESRLGGILKQCIHDGFGLIRFGKKLSGPEYAEWFIEEFEKENIEALTLTFVTKITKEEDTFLLTAVNRKGVIAIETKTIVLATGCRERTAKQVFIHGTRPSGVFTAGTAQYLINILGQMPARRAVVLGSGDIGLIMARRLTLEGADVLGVYEAKSTPSGLTRNIHQCLYDFNIPLYLSKTVTRLFGEDRLTAVEICDVDENFKPLDVTSEVVACDTLILSVGLIPENELAEMLETEIDPLTKGPVCDESLMTSIAGVFSCGNALHVNDLVDYVSESGERAGKAAALHAKKQRPGGAPWKDESSGRLIRFNPGKDILYLVPQQFDLSALSAPIDPSDPTVPDKKTVMYFRSSRVLGESSLIISVNGTEVFRKQYPFLRPPEMERLEFDFSALGLNVDSQVTFIIEEDS